METWMILAAIGVFSLFAIVLYNRLVALQQNRKNAFADIDVQLKLRYDLVPNLIETVKGYAAHESTVFKDVTEARSRAMHGGALPDRLKAEAALGSALMNLMAVAENYPQLKANENFGRLQSELADIENKIAASRRFFNNATDEYNTYRQQFPAVLVARMFAFGPENYFDLGTDERSKMDIAPKVAF